MYVVHLLSFIINDNCHMDNCLNLTRKKLFKIIFILIGLHVTWTQDAHIYFIVSRLTAHLNLFIFFSNYFNGQNAVNSFITFNINFAASYYNKNSKAVSFMFRKTYIILFECDLVVRFQISKSTYRFSIRLNKVSLVYLFV